MLCSSEVTFPPHTHPHTPLHTLLFQGFMLIVFVMLRSFSCPLYKLISLSHHSGGVLTHSFLQRPFSSLLSVCILLWTVLLMFHQNIQVQKKSGFWLKYWNFSFFLCSFDAAQHNLTSDLIQLCSTLVGFDFFTVISSVEAKQAQIITRPTPCSLAGDGCCYIAFGFAKQIGVHYDKTSLSLYLFKWVVAHWHNFNFVQHSTKVWNYTLNNWFIYYVISPNIT